MTTYKVTQSAVTQLLEDVRREHIAIPELQRPFVWDSVKVRDLMGLALQGLLRRLPHHMAVHRRSPQRRPGRSPPADPHRWPTAHYRASRSSRRGDQDS